MHLFSTLAQTVHFYATDGTGMGLILTSTKLLMPVEVGLDSPKSNWPIKRKKHNKKLNISRFKESFWKTFKD